MELERNSESLENTYSQEEGLEVESEITEELESDQEEPCQESQQESDYELSQAEGDVEPLRGSFRAEEELLAYSQEVSFSIYFFGEDIWYDNGESDRMPAASVIKVYIMRYVYSLMESGEISSDYLIGGQRAGELIRVMIQQSDNHATNALIDYFGMESINQYLLEQGYRDTVLQRRMLDDEARNLGLDNYTSTRDTMEFLRRLYSNQSIFPYNEILEVMLGQQFNTKIPLFLPDDATVANKTGELDDIENDIGIVFTEDAAFAIVVLSQGVNDTERMRRGIGLLALEALEYIRENKGED